MADAAEVADRLRIEPEVAEILVDDLLERAKLFEFWKHNNDRGFERMAMELGVQVMESRIRRRMDPEQYEQLQERRLQRAERMEERMADIDDRAMEQMGVEREWAEKEYGINTPEYMQHMFELQGRPINYPIDFKAITDQATAYGLGKRLISEVVGKPRKIRRMLTAGEALEEEYFPPARAEAMREKQQTYGSQQIYSQHKVIFLQPGEAFTQEDLEREIRESPSAPKPESKKKAVKKEKVPKKRKKAAPKVTVASPFFQMVPPPEPPPPMPKFEMAFDNPFRK